MLPSFESRINFFRYYVINQLPKLKFLDSTAVTEEERQEAERRGHLMKIAKPQNVSGKRILLSFVDFFFPPRDNFLIYKIIFRRIMKMKYTFLSQLTILLCRKQKEQHMIIKVIITQINHQNLVLFFK